MTTATIKLHSATWATLEINYANGGFSFHRLEGNDLYERGYELACHQARAHGFRLDRYSRT